jgi:competence protein ComEA
MIRFITALVFAFSSLVAQAAVDVNKASQADLETLRGVGPALSGKIMDARKSGDFKSWQDLVDRVSGIGPASANRLSQSGLTVAGTSYTGGATKPAAERATNKAEKPAKPQATTAKDSR